MIHGLVLVLALCIAPSSGRLAASPQRILQRVESHGESSDGNLTRGTKLAAVQPLEPYSYTLSGGPSEGERPWSLIYLAPWNGTTDWNKVWLLNYFDKHEPLARKKFRVLNVVGRKMPAQDYDSYPYRSWYEYIDWHMETVVEHDVDLAVQYIHSLIEKERAIVGDYRHIVLAGYSQGANVALEAALSFPHRLGLVVSQRGMLLARRAQDTSPLAATPYILTAGAWDEVYYPQWIDENRRWLEKKNTPAYLRTFDAVDHAKRSSRESELAVNAFASMAIGSPGLARLTDWTDSPQ